MAWLRSPLALPLACLLPVVACGPTDPSFNAGSDTDTGSETDAGSASASGSTDTSTTGASDGTAASDSGPGSTSDTATTGTVPTTCEDLVPERSGAVTLILRNEGDAAIFIDQFSCGPTLSVALLDGSPILWQAPLCDAPTCEAMLAGDCSVACGDCAGGVLRVDPGGSVEAVWDGTIFAEAAAPADCRTADCDARCFQELAAEPGTYSLQTSVLSECPYSDPMICECPDGQSVCSITSFDEFPDATPFIASTSFTYDGSETTVELVVPYE